MCLFLPDGGLPLVLVTCCASFIVPIFGVPVMCPYMYMCVCVRICICTEHDLCSVLCCTLGFAFPTWAVLGGFILLSVHLLNEALFFLVLLYFVPSHCCFQIFSAIPPHGVSNYNRASLW